MVNYEAQAIYGFRMQAFFIANQALIINYLSAAMLLGLGGLIARRVRHVFLSVLSRYFDRTLSQFLTNVAYVMIVLIVAIMALTKVGVPTTSLLAILGAASLTIALSLKDFLSNIAASVLIILLRPFKIGDFIEHDKTTGIVEEVNLFQTRLRTASNEVFFLPNHKVIHSVIKNLSYYPMRRGEWTITVEYGQDVVLLKQLLLTIAEENAKVQDSPKPYVLVKQISEQGVEVQLRFWCLKEDLNSVRFELNEAALVSFYANDVKLPQTNMMIAKVA